MLNKFHKSVLWAENLTTKTRKITGMNNSKSENDFRKGK
jgi:hypothetical protein